MSSDIKIVMVILAFSTAIACTVVGVATGMHVMAIVLLWVSAFSAATCTASLAAVFVRGSVNNPKN